MTYTPRSWADGELYTAEDVNRLEQGVADVSGALDALNDPVNLGTTNLNDATEPGVPYAQTANAGASAALNYPAPEAGALENLQYSPTNADRVIQRYTTFQALDVYHRSRFNGAWSAWQKNHEYTTGWRSCPNPPDVLGSIWCVRDGNYVTVQASNVRGAAGTVDFGTLPLGMRPRSTVTVPAQGGGTLTVGYTGRIYLSGEDNAAAWRSAAVTFRVIREDVRPAPPFSPA